MKRTRSAAWRKWREGGTLEPRVLLGHSLGELTALAAAGSLSFADGLRLVQRRGLAMAAADPGGGMVAVLGLDAEKVASVIADRAAPGVVIANFNSPRQVVLSGPAAELERVQKPLRQAGARLVALRVSVACHSPRMEGAAKELRPVIESLPVRPPRWPVISNVTGRPHGGPEEIRRRLSEHITSPVRFQQSLEWVLQRQIRDFVEIGPGDALGGLVRQLDRGCRLTRFDGSGTEGAT
jgi:[acyl-carrier-protein] S-malonyltransferase